MSSRQLLSALVLVLVSVCAAAQTPVSGRVTDPTGGAVTGATVTLAGPGAAAPVVITTGSDGSFAFPIVPPGASVLTVQAAGFQRWSRAVDPASLTGPVDVVLPIPGFSESVAVTAPRLEEESPQALERVGVRVQTITSTQIQGGGYYDLAQTLQALVPGLFLMPRSGPFDYVSASLQGSRTNEILWLVDGVRISNRLYNSVTPVDTIPANMIERIEIIEGGQGLIYGTSAVAGVINVVTKSFADATNGQVQGGFDSNRGGHTSFFTRGTARDHKFVAFASKDQAQGYQNFPSSQYQPSATDRRRSYDVVTLGGKYAYDFSKNTRLSAGYQTNRVTLDNLRPARSGASQVGGHAAAFNERQEQIFNAKLDYSPRRDAEFFFKTYYHQWDSQWTERRNVASAPGTTRTISDGEFWGFKDYGANVLAKLTPTRGLEYVGGYEFQNYRGSDEVLLIDPTSETVHALFGQLRTTRALFEKASLSLGARFNAPSNSQTAAVWNASGQYDFTAGFFARGTVGTAFRYPDAYELFAKDPTCCFGNPNLAPERSTNLNASLGHRVAAGSTTLTMEVVGFYRRVKDLIVDVDDGSGETTITANQPDLVRVRGVQLVGSAAFAPAVSASLSYTYSRSQQSNELSGGFDALTGIPANQVDATVDLHPVRAPFGLTLSVNGVGRITDSVSGLGAIAGGRYTVVDLSGRYFLDARRQHRVNVRLENLFNEEYTTLHARGFQDASGSAYLVNTLGVPRTLHVSYSLGF
jgi:outer membrane cobalamin receptor